MKIMDIKRKDSKISRIEIDNNVRLAIRRHLANKAVKGTVVGQYEWINTALIRQIVADKEKKTL